VSVVLPALAGAAGETGEPFYAPSDEALATRAALRRLLGDRHDPRQVHERIVGDAPYDPALWQQLARDVGVCAVLAPAGIGGLGLGYAEFAVVAGELGAVLYTGPFWGTAVLGMPVLLSLAGASPAAAELARRVTAGELNVALAHRDSSGLRVDAARLSGRARLVVDAAAAGLLLVVAEHHGERGLFAVQPGDVRIEEVESIDPTRRLGDVVFDEAPAEVIASGSAVDDALAVAALTARVAVAADAVRGAEEALALAVEYAKQREQFGRPIGVHQAVKHKCADGLIAVQTAKAALAYACAAMDAGAAGASVAVTAAKLAGVDAYLRVAADAIQIHGTFGYTRDSLTQSYFRRARWLSLAVASAGDDREATAQVLLEAAPDGELFPVGMPADDDPRRRPVREWLGAHPRPSGRELLDAGYMVPHWAPPVGLGADGELAVIVDQELRRAGVERPRYPLARDFVAPLIATAGTAEQQARYITPMLSGDDIWCELFSEPGAGSDLASLTTTATRTAEGYVVQGVKTWTSQAHLARYGLLLARTDPSAPKHRGISCFIVAMDAPGVTLQPIRSMEGEAKWCLVYLDGVVVGPGDMVGAENQGWRAALDVLANERLSMSATPGLLWGEGPTYADLLDVARRLNSHGELPGHLRQRLVAGHQDAQALHVMRMQAIGRLGYAKSDDGEVVPEVRRALADMHGQAMLELWRDLHGVDGVMLQPDGREDAWAPHYFAARSLTLGGGTSEIQRNILSERVLGLPRG
jgi:alkylation response protein AidB-like acyl-CoA dehydrogenase